jgi:isopenicillin N synthase-like dioxygenase
MSLSAALELVDVGRFLRDGADQSACTRLARCLTEYGAVLISDSRVTDADAVQFRALMEAYFEQPREDKLLDARPELHYQVGVTPNKVERVRVSCTAALLSTGSPWARCP